MEKCRSPIQRQRIITTIKKKNVNEKKKKKLKSLVRFYSANKIDNNGGGIKGKKIQKYLQNKSKHKNNKCFFLSHCCQCPFPHWESQSTSPP